MKVYQIEIYLVNILSWGCYGYWNPLVFFLAGGSETWMDYHCLMVPIPPFDQAAWSGVESEISKWEHMQMRNYSCTNYDTICIHNVPAV